MEDNTFLNQKNKKEQKTFLRGKKKETVDKINKA